jgi:seryl-tRNA synthetase
VVNIAAGDLGGSAAKKYDIEVWLPGQNRNRALTSCPKHHRLPGPPDADAVAAIVGGDRGVHTLNGTATGVGRTLIAILENHQRATAAFPCRTPSTHLPEGLRELRAHT